MKRTLEFTARIVRSAALPAVIVVFAAAVLWGCKNNVNPPDLKAKVVFVGDSVNIENPTDADWHDVNVTLDDEYAYHFNTIPAQEVATATFDQFQNEDNQSFPISRQHPKTVLIKCDMGRYWGEF